MLPWAISQGRPIRPSPLRQWSISPYLKKLLDCQEKFRKFTLFRVTFTQKGKKNYLLPKMAMMKISASFPHGMDAPAISPSTLY